MQVGLPANSHLTGETLMWTDIGSLFLWSTLLAVVVAYACWCSVRVTFFRQELFEVRDDLWRRAFKLGCLDDPAYKHTRKLLNSTINVAPMLSAHVIVGAIMFSAREQSGVSKSENKDLQSAIDDARWQFLKLTAIYVFLWRASGAIAIALMAALCAAVAIVQYKPIKRFREFMNASLDDLLSTLIALADSKQRAQVGR